MADRLVAWLHGTPVAELTPAPEFRIRMEWRAEAIERWGLGSPALSVGLPVGTPAGPRDMRGLDFFENMLPEGPALARMATLAGVRPVDTYGILAAFGHRTTITGSQPAREPHLTAGGPAATRAIRNTT